MNFDQLSKGYKFQMKRNIRLLSDKSQRIHYLLDRSELFERKIGRKHFYRGQDMLVSRILYIPAVLPLPIIN